MELKRSTSTGSAPSSPSQNNNLFRLIIIVLAACSVFGVLLILLMLLGFFRPRPQTAQITPTLVPLGTAPAVGINPTNAVATSLASQPTVAPGAVDTTLPHGTNPAPAAITATPALLTVIPSVTPLTSPAATSVAKLVPPTNLRSALAVTALRVDPPNPVRNEPVGFKMTFLNRTGAPQVKSLCTEIWRPGENKSFGQTHCAPQTIPTGASELSTGGWILTGIKQCSPFRARVVEQDEDSIRTPILQTNGAPLWLDFNVCP